MPPDFAFGLESSEEFEELSSKTVGAWDTDGVADRCADDIELELRGVIPQ